MFCLNIICKSEISISESLKVGEQQLFKFIIEILSYLVTCRIGMKFLPERQQRQLTQGDPGLSR